MIQKDVLTNGIEVLTERMGHVRSVSLGIWVKVGSRDEDSNNNGISHFIEHLMFKGTKNRTAKEIAEELDAVGGQLNAFTSKEYTCYYAKVLDEHTDLAIDILSDMVLNSKFAEEDINKEKNVVLEEIKMYEDTPDDIVHDIFTEGILKGHPLGRPIIGTKDIIENLTKGEIESFFKSYYVPENIVIAAAGSLDHKNILASFEERFGKLEGKAPQRSILKPIINKHNVYRGKEVEQVHLCLGGKGLAIKDKAVYPLHLLNNILGGGLSSRLFQKIREDLGLAYSVYSYHSSYQETGIFSIYAGLSLKNLDQFLSSVSEELKDIRFKGFQAEELARAKNQLKGNMFLGLESTSSRMSRLGKSQINLGKVLPPDEIIAKIDNVSLENMNDLAQQMFNLEEFSLVAIGPKGKEVKLQWL